MGKRKLVGKVFIVFIVFILLILPVLNIQAFGFNFDNFQNKHETRKEYFSRMLDKMCAIRIKINQKHPRFPVPRICKTENLNPPTLEFYAEPASIIEGESSVLNWASDNTLSCEGSDGWMGEKTISGIEIIWPQTTTTYTLSCDGVEKGIEKSVIVEVVPLSPPAPVDVCPNISDIQIVIPEGYHFEGEQCIENEVDPPVSCIDINTASKEELDEIINIGPATADKIIAYRQITPFTSVGDLINISGIGEVTLSEIIAQGKACVLNP
ncbi:MAG: hypothetical protein UR80_C0020G0011 [Parcubacteria group bacterium GW2011_GWB1_35_5]|uniref:Helix-hairpin-helix DNA-binding motif class 1 domain-containing protein n=1 Tax=Candidatus Zambryskibacteria bacterium RIFCSPLOWO2_01_FULL_35_19 TaxID=1802757 RepID=A0A1G2TXQ6_9BACT|nr:MAG: hypothetical protein UR50_C0004G0009 [Parcubacteria group bacterium GW2011_GWC1_34_10]KKP80737.1 MAG: hypothetical protein UR80_C0020G0011 [Parcubacteria group bacterium GW2011_GWB1_35_5]OHA85914.1 MAG: hypothetical protein A2726_02535 [Candidatus Zambryskibacteria bacterium RIFCSPHIGHO2_01_FULL_35_32]OHB02088.1 MAG: hypothetical protein A3A90_02395 [Candidatus Zambryskibacteria bacterium RIFCSPLOWO2_01_FULL_35_19]